MTLIVIITIIMFLVLVRWTWSNLGDIDKGKKLLYTLASIVIMFGITFVIFTISKSKVTYSNEEMVAPVRLLLVSIFTAINGYIVVQYIARIIGLIDVQEIDKSIANKRFKIIMIIFIIVAFIEVFYMRDIQNGILERMNSLGQ